MPNWTQKPRLGTPLNHSHPLAGGLVGCWVMNEGSGTLVKDSSGHGNDGVFTNPKWVAGNPRFDDADDGYITAAGMYLGDASGEKFSIVIKFLLTGTSSLQGYLLWEMGRWKAFQSACCRLTILPFGCTLTSMRQ